MVLEPIGTVRVVRRLERALVVAEPDALNGTPVIDIKPVMREFLPRSALVEPPRSVGLMARYWNPS